MLLNKEKNTFKNTQCENSRNGKACQNPESNQELTKPPPPPTNNPNRQQQRQTQTHPSWTRQSSNIMSYKTYTTMESV
jgi:hypothetical protein